MPLTCTNIVSRRIFGVVIAAAFLATPVAAEEEARIDYVSMGFRGKFKVGRWTPISAIAQVPDNKPVRLVVECFDSSGNRAQFSSPLADPSAPRSGRFISGRIDSPIRVSIVDENGTELTSAANS